MNASAKPTERRPEARDTERRPEARDEDPTKGGGKPAHETAYPSGDSPKPHGDRMQRAVDEAAGRKSTR